jgi:hypothetical protein
VEFLTVEPPPPSSTLVRRWREATAIAHRAEREALLNAMRHNLGGIALDPKLKPTAVALRRAAEDARREAFHPSHFPELTATPRG